MLSSPSPSLCDHDCEPSVAFSPLFTDQSQGAAHVPAADSVAAWRFQTPGLYDLAGLGNLFLNCENIFSYKPDRSNDRPAFSCGIGGRCQLYRHNLRLRSPKIVEIRHTLLPLFRAQLWKEGYWEQWNEESG